MTKGTNQYKGRVSATEMYEWRLLALIFFTIIITAVGVALVQPKIVSPCSESGCLVERVMAYEEKSELEQITDYIIKKFQPYGRTVAVQALACFISESGLRPDAVNVNSDAVKSTDVGIAQINLYWHRESAENMTDWKKNIDKAEQIYKQRKNFSSWYGKACK